MRIKCPKCQSDFNAKVNARRIKCPECGFREDAPEGGFAEAFAGKPKTGHFAPVVAPSSPQRSVLPALVAGILVILAVGAAAWFLIGDGADNGDDPGTKPVHVLIRTSVGNMTAELNPGKAPKTVENFLTYVREGFYTDLAFYRIEPGFVTQGGGENVGKTGAHPPVQNEAISSGLKNAMYTLAMARTDNPDSATTEFYINMADNCFLDPKGQSSCPERAVSDEGYAVFGSLVTGCDVADTMNRMSPDSPPTFTVMILEDGSQPGTPCGSVAPTTSTTQAPAGNCATQANRPTAKPAGDVDLDLITPGVWNVCGNTDFMYVWVRNDASASRDYTWDITGPGGAPLPEGWKVTFREKGGSLAPSGTRNGQGPGPHQYPDHGATLVTLAIPASQPAGEVAGELHAAGQTRPFTFVVQAERGAVTKVGDNIQTCYDLTSPSGFHQANAFDLPAGGTRAVAGYSFGVVGVALGETATLIVPPPFAYGWGANFSGETLTWATKVVQDPSTCPKAG